MHTRHTIFATFALLALLALLAVPADAGERYVKLIGGLGDLDDGGGLVVDDPDFAPGTADADYGSGFGFGAAFGADLGRFTLELDYLYRSNDFDRVTFADGSSVREGNYASVTIGANAYFVFAQRC